MDAAYLFMGKGSTLNIIRGYLDAELKMQNVRMRCAGMQTASNLGLLLLLFNRTTIIF
jgi:hypothetical protein